MAALAKVLGVCSMAVGLLVGCVGLWAFASIESTWTDAAAGEALLIGIGFGAIGLLLITLGVAAYVVGEVGEWVEEQRRLRRQPPAGVATARPYGASSR